MVQVPEGARVGRKGTARCAEIASLITREIVEFVPWLLGRARLEAAASNESGEARWP